MRICSMPEHRLKHEWNQTIWSLNNLRCGTPGASPCLARIKSAFEMNNNKGVVKHATCTRFSLRGVVLENLEAFLASTR
jgi:hypothetical protein